MKNKGLWIAVVAVLAIAVVVYFAFFSNKDQTNVSAEPEVIKLGFIGPLTGPAAAYGLNARNGAIIAVNDINENGGVLGGKKIELVIQDNKGDTTETVNIMNKLIEQDKVVGIIGPVTTGPTTVAAGIAGEKKVPIVSPTATGDNITKLSEYVARVCFYDSYQGPIMAKFVAENLEKKTAAILYDNTNDYSMGLADSFALKFAEYGGEIVAKESFSEGDQDFNAQLTNIAAKNPDVVFVPAYYSDDAQILLQARQMGFNAIFTGGDGWDSQELINGAGAAAEGCYFTTHYSAADESELVQDFIKKYKEKYNAEPNFAGPLAYDAALLLADAIERAGEADPVKINQEILNTKGLTGVTGEFSFDENRNPLKEVTIATVIDGKFALVDKVRP